MMARVRPSSTTDSTGVPEELFDHGHPVWSDARLTEQWCRRHRLPPSLAKPHYMDSPAERFNRCADAWAGALGLAASDGAPTTRAVLTECGVERIRALERSRVRSAMPPALEIEVERSHIEAGS